jgi:Domain of unknown function (DUF1841)
MDEKRLNNLTLSSWAAGVWEKELRGVPLQLQEAALAWCMRKHSDWRNFWNSLNNTDAVNTPRATNLLVHIYNDAAVKLQLDSNNPSEINQCFQAMQGTGFSEMDALHAIAFVLQEQSWNAKTAGVAFDQKQYIERVKQYVKNVIEHPELIRGLRVT